MIEYLGNPTNGFGWDKILPLVAKHGHNLILYRASNERGARVSEETILRCVATDDMVFLNWVATLGPLPPFFTDYAAKHGQLGVLMWACENGSELKASTLERALESGNIEVLEWLDHQGCPRNDPYEIILNTG